MSAFMRIAKTITLCCMAILDRLTILPVIGHVIAFFRQRIAGAFIVHPGILNEVKK